MSERKIDGGREKEKKKRRQGEGGERREKTRPFAMSHSLNSDTPIDHLPRKRRIPLSPVLCELGMAMHATFITLAINAMLLCCLSLGFMAYGLTTKNGRMCGVFCVPFLLSIPALKILVWAALRTDSFFRRSDEEEARFRVLWFRNQRKRACVCAALVVYISIFAICYMYDPLSEVLAYCQ
jgi:hypothetical protein